MQSKWYKYMYKCTYILIIRQWVYAVWRWWWSHFLYTIYIYMYNKQFLFRSADLWENDVYIPLTQRCSNYWIIVQCQCTDCTPTLAVPRKNIFGWQMHGHWHSCSTKGSNAMCIGYVKPWIICPYQHLCTLIGCRKVGQICNLGDFGGMLAKNGLQCPYWRDFDEPWTRNNVQGQECSRSSSTNPGIVEKSLSQAKTIE